MSREYFLPAKALHKFALNNLVVVGAVSIVHHRHAESRDPVPSNRLRVFDRTNLASFPSIRFLLLSVLVVDRRLSRASAR